MPFLPILAFFLDDETLVSAAKADDLKEKYPELAEEIDALADADPTPQKKYLQWSVGQLQAGAAVGDLIEAVKEYDKALPRLQGKDKDIGSFKTLADMQAVVEKAAAVETKGDVRKKAKKGGVILHEDDRWMLVRPDTQEASIYYGSNTAWCVARRDLKENYWYYYFGDRNVRFYFLIDKQAKPRTADDKGYHFSKVAMMIRKQKPYTDEPFQDAANKQPHAAVIEDAIGPVFNEMHDLAIADSKKLPLNTWAYQLFHDEDLDSASFLSLYDEHIEEIKGFNREYKDKIDDIPIDLAEENNKRVNDMLLAYCKELAKNTGYYIPLSGDAQMSPEVKILDKVRHERMSKETAQAVLDIFSRSANEDLRERVAHHKQLTKEVVQRLLSDTSGVQKAMLGNPIMMKDPELKSLAVEKIDSKMNTGAWSGLMVNRALPSDLFDKLVEQPPQMMRAEYEDVLEEMLDRIDIQVLAKGIGDEEEQADAQAEIDYIEKRVEKLLKVRRLEFTKRLAYKIAIGSSESSIIELLRQIEARYHPNDGYELLIKIAKNEHLTLGAQKELLKIKKHELTGDSKHDAILYHLARNDGLNHSVINDILALAVDLLANEDIDVTSKTGALSYKDIILNIAMNSAVSPENTKFLAKHVEDSRSSLALEDFDPNSDFAKVNRTMPSIGS